MMQLVNEQSLSLQRLSLWHLLQEHKSNINNIVEEESGNSWLCVREYFSVLRGEKKKNILHSRELVVYNTTHTLLLPAQKKWL